jgi:hypothetical protein
VAYQNDSAAPVGGQRQKSPTFWFDFTPKLPKKFLVDQADFLTRLPYCKATSRLVDWSIAYREGGQL